MVTKFVLTNSSKFPIVVAPRSSSSLAVLSFRCNGPKGSAVTASLIVNGMIIFIVGEVNSSVALMAYAAE
jgi:hypothetical protein